MAAVSEFSQMRPYLAFVLSPLIVLVGWCINFDGTLAPAFAWLIDAPIAYAGFLAVHAIRSFVEKALPLQLSYPRAVLTAVIAAVLSTILRAWQLQSTYGSYQKGADVLVENAHLTHAGMIVVLKDAAVDGTLIGMASLVYFAIRGKSGAATSA